MKRISRTRPVALVIEDQRIFRAMLIELMSRDYDILIACSVGEAIRYYADNAPDLVFIDIDLPDGSGQQVLNAVTDVDPDCYALMFTASNTHEDVELATRNGAKGYIVKPFTRRKIEDHLRQFRKATAR